MACAYCSDNDDFCSELETVPEDFAGHNDLITPITPNDLSMRIF